MKIELILLAGGDSKRFAAKSNESGGKKLLALFKGKPLFEYALKAAETFKPFGRVTVVTGEESIRLAAQEKGFRTVCPPPPTEGIAASVRTGTAAADEDSHLCFMVCDQPYFTGEMLKDFISAYLISGKTLGRVRCGKQMGSPTVFAPVHRQALGETVARDRDQPYFHLGNIQHNITSYSMADAKYLNQTSNYNVDDHCNDTIQRIECRDKMTSFLCPQI